MGLGWLIGWTLAGCASETPIVPVDPPVVEPAPPTEVVAAPVPEPPPEPPAPPPPPPPPPRPKDPYLALRYDIDQERQALARRQQRGEEVLADAQAEIDKRLPQLIDSWKGTRWSYSGTTETPKKGKIACGYFVSTVLQHAGFDVDRVDLARQASEQILRTVIPEDQIERFSWASRDKVVSRIEAMGHGVYLVGLDTHIGFLVNSPGLKVNFCHSSSRNHRMGVVCETARTSPSLKSDLTVVGRLGLQPLVDAWLAAGPLPAAHKGVAQPLALWKAPPIPPATPTPPIAPTNDGVAGTL